MKKTFVYLLGSILLISCGQNQSSVDSNKQIEEPVTFESALKKAYGPSVTNVPDTIALGYHWGMNRTEVNSHIKALAQSKKVYYKSNKGYMYPMPLTHYAETGKKQKIMYSAYQRKHIRIPSRLLISGLRGKITTIVAIFLRRNTTILQ